MALRILLLLRSYFPSPHEIVVFIEVPYPAPAVYGKPIAVFSRVAGKVKILSRHPQTVFSGKSLKPRATQSFVLEHGYTPEIETHACPAALNQSTIRVRRLRTEIRRWVLRISPNLRYTPFAFRMVETAYAGKLGIILHAID